METTAHGDGSPRAADPSALRPMTANTDARAVRTRAKLVEAFHRVVRDTAPDAITVTALTRAAGVNRTSFYEHFASPEDLAVHALGDLLDVLSSADILDRAEGLGAEEACRRAMREIVDFVWERRASYARLLGPSAPARVPTAVAEAFARHGQRALRGMPTRPADADPELAAHFIAAGTLHVIGRWLAEPGGHWTRERLTTALVHCLPGWVTSD